MPCLIKIIPIAQRAKNRVEKHGEYMFLLCEGTFDGKYAILVESREKTCRGEFWLGWFTYEEVEWKKIRE